MKTWHKVTIGAGVVVALGGIVLFSVNQANKGVVTVQTAKVAKQDSLVSLVTASGEIKPTTYTNVTAQGFGRIIEILVKEGDHVKKGDRLLLQAQLEQSHAQLNQSRAVLVRTQDVLRKTTYTSPINGIVSYLPERVGDYVVPGIQNSNGSFLMTLSDMSVVTAEVKVDETDIVNVKMGQEADVTIDAVPGKVFKGKVTEIGSQAVLRSSGLTTTQTTTSTQEAKDFKVVVTLTNPPENLRPGLSTTAKIKTAERKNVVAIPIQALAVRTRKDLEEAAKKAKDQGSSGVTLAAPPPPAPGDPKKDEVQGVFVVNGTKAVFLPVETGIAGVTDIEITKGLKAGDEIVVGSYKALRTLKPEAQVKVDNSAPKKQEDQQS